MNKQLIVCLCLFALLLPLGLSAQTSNTYVATSEQFKTETDKFMSVTDWMVIKNSLFTLSFNTNSVVDVGYGFKLVPEFYLGAWYDGNILKNTSAPTETTGVDTTMFLNNGVVIGKQVKTTKSVSGDVTYSVNQGDILAGFSNMGIKLGVYQQGALTKDRFRINIGFDPWFNRASATTWDLLDNFGWTTGGQDVTNDYFAADGSTKTGGDSTLYTNGARNIGEVTPRLAWGGNFNLGGLIFKPTVGLSFGFLSNNLTQSWATITQAIGSGYTAFNGVSEVSSAETRDVNQHADYDNFAAEANLAFEIPNKEDLLKLALYYRLDLPIYSNSYFDTTGNAATVAGYGYDYHQVKHSHNVAVDDTTDLRVYQVDTYKDRAKHNITPVAQYVAKLAPSLSMSGTLDVPLIFESYSHTVSGALVSQQTYTDINVPNNSYTDVYRKTYTGDTESVSTFDMDPQLKVGLQYDVLPKVLKFNLGGAFNISGVHTKTKTVTQTGLTTVTHVQTMADGSTPVNTYTPNLGSTRNESQTVSTQWDGLDTSVTAGINFVLIEGISLDLNCVIGFSSITPPSNINYTSTAINSTVFTVELQIVK